MNHGRATICLQRRSVLAALLLLSLGTACLSGGCAVYEIDALNRDLRVAPAAEPPVSGVDPAALHLINTTARDPAPAAYLLGGGDVLRVSIFQLDTLGEERVLTLTVSAEGRITVPLIGQCQVGGRTTEQVAEDIRQRLEKDYIRRPRVKVEIAEHRSRVVAVMGAVAHPGRYPVYGRAMSVIDVLGAAGGLAETADDEVHVVRGALRTDGGAAAAGGEALSLRLSQMVRRGPAAPVLVYPGDLVTVSQRGETRFYVTGHVLRPGSYNRPTNMTLLQALTVAGGLAETADPSSLKILRQRAAGGEQLIEVNLKEIASGEQPDVRIEPADLVVVPTTTDRRTQAEIRRFFSRLISVGVDARYNAID